MEFNGRFWQLWKAEGVVAELKALPQIVIKRPEGAWVEKGKWESLKVWLLGMWGDRASECIQLGDTVVVCGGVFEEDRVAQPGEYSFRLVLPPRSFWGNTSLEITGPRPPDHTFTANIKENGGYTVSRRANSAEPSALRTRPTSTMAVNKASGDFGVPQDASAAPALHCLPASFGGVPLSLQRLCLHVLNKNLRSFFLQCHAGSILDTLECMFRRTTCKTTKELYSLCMGKLQHECKQQCMDGGISRNRPKSQAKEECARMDALSLKRVLQLPSPHAACTARRSPRPGANNPFATPPPAGPRAATSLPMGLAPHTLPKASGSGKVHKKKQPQKRRVSWSLPEERALKDAVGAGYHGKWNEVLRDPRWARALSRRDGVQLKDKARNMNFGRQK